MAMMVTRSLSWGSQEDTSYGGFFLRGVKWLWNRWIVVTVAWYLCATFTAAAIKRSQNRAMLSVFANLVMGWPLVLPFALMEGVPGWKRLRTHWRKVALIAVLAGLEKNLTNSSLSSIGGALKTALHGLNVVFTFFVAAISGADDRAYYCIRGCRCSGNLLLSLSLVLVASGSVFALPDPKHGSQDAWKSSHWGVVLQLGSGLAYAMKFTAIKLLLCGNEQSPNVEQRAPSKAHVVLFCNPVIGLMSLALVPLGPNNWSLPPMGLAVAVAVAATPILVLQMQLIQLLKSPVTVAVLAVFHDLMIVLYFVLMGGETFSEAQVIGYAVSAVGAVLYSCAKYRYSDLADQDSDECNSSIENERSYSRTPQALALQFSFSTSSSSFR